MSQNSLCPLVAGESLDSQGCHLPPCALVYPAKGDLILFPPHQLFIILSTYYVPVSVLG